MKNASDFDWDNGFIVYTEDDIKKREYLTNLCFMTIRDTWNNANKAVTFERVETPCLTPAKFLQSHIDAKFELLTVGSSYLRPETTAGLYQVLNGKKLPHCVWQLGKSFRDENLGKFRFSNMRFREFYQLEFELSYSEGTKVDYQELAINALCNTFNLVSEIPTDLPHYSSKTVDLHKGELEIIATSTRTDFKNPICEISIGMDRLASVIFKE